MAYITGQPRKTYTWRWTSASGSTTGGTISLLDYAGPVGIWATANTFTGTVKYEFSLDGTAYLIPALADNVNGTTGASTAIIYSTATQNYIYSTQYQIPWHSARAVVSGTAGTADFTFYASPV